MPRRPAAAIDLGSTSVHLLVARPDRTGLVVLHDESTFLGLGAAVDGPGSLGVSGRATLASTVGALRRPRPRHRRARIRSSWAPSRSGGWRTPPGSSPRSRRGRACPLAVLEHEEEALLTLVGLTAGRAVRGDLLVVDIGGGSSELVEIGPERLARAAGVRLGAGRLTRSIVDRDPPTREQFAALDRAAAEALDWTPGRQPAEVVFVGGTATNLLKLLRRAGDPERGDRLDRAALDEARGRSSRPARPSCSRRPTGCARPGSGCSPRAPRSSRPCSTGSTSPRAGSSTRGSARARSSPPTGPATAWRDRLEELAHGWIA